MSDYICTKCKRAYLFGGHPDRCYDCNGNVFVKKDVQRTLERYDD